MLGEGGKSLLNFLCLLRKLLAGKTGKAGTNEKKNPFVRFTGLLLSSCLEILPEQAFVLLNNCNLFSPQKYGEREKMFVHLYLKEQISINSLALNLVRRAKLTYKFSHLYFLVYSMFSFNKYSCFCYMIGISTTIKDYITGI